MKWAILKSYLFLFYCRGWWFGYFDFSYYSPSWRELRPGRKSVWPEETTSKHWYIKISSVSGPTVLQHSQSKYWPDSSCGGLPSFLDGFGLEGLADVFAPPPPRRQTAVLPPLTTLLTDVDPNVFPAVSYKFERVNFRRFQLLNTGRLYPCCHEQS